MSHVACNRHVSTRSPEKAREARRNQQQEPGGEFHPPDHWRLPAEWLTPFSAKGVWQWQASGRRLRLKHPEKFFVFDLPLAADDPRKQLRRELQAYAGVAGIKLQRADWFDEAAGESALQRWLSWLMPYARARLNRALGLTEADDLSRTLCAHHARVFVTATHLDVFFSLDQLPIEIRLSGLDRSPGWVPAAAGIVGLGAGRAAPAGVAAGPDVSCLAAAASTSISAFRLLGPGL